MRFEATFLARGPFEAFFFRLLAMLADIRMHSARLQRNEIKWDLLY